MKLWARTTGGDPVTFLPLKFVLANVPNAPSDKQGFGKETNGPKSARERASLLPTRDNPAPKHQSPSFKAAFSFLTTCCLKCRMISV